MFSSIKSTLNTLHSIPITLCLCAATVGVYYFGAVLNPLLALTQSTLSEGELWRLWTGHFTHWTLEHLVWDLIVFGVVAGSVERKVPKKFWRILGIQAGIIGAVMLAFTDYTEYRGLSGIDSGLFTWLCLHSLERSTTHARRIAAFSTVALLLFLGKTLFECVTGQTLFVQDLGEGVSAAPLAHLSAAAAAIVGCLLTNLISGAIFFSLSKQSYRI